MERVIDFYFDFVSPYGYFAAIVKVMGLQPLMKTPLKSTYVLRDVERLSAIYALPVLPRIMALHPVLLRSAFYTVKEGNADILPTFAKQLFAHIWHPGDLVRNANDLESIARRAGKKCGLGVITDGNGSRLTSTQGCNSRCN